MKEAIINQNQSPLELEKLYQSDKKSFKKAIFQALAEKPEDPVLQCWQARFLVEEQQGVGVKINATGMVIIALLMGAILQLPKWFAWDEDQFYPKFIAITIFAGLSYLFLVLKKSNLNQFVAVSVTLALAWGYLQISPKFVGPDTQLLLVLHLSVLLAFVYAFAYMGQGAKEVEPRIQWLKFSGDVFLMSGLLLLGFFLFSALTMALFNSIRIDAGYYYAKYVVVWLLAPIPVIAATLVYINHQLVSKISPLIARIFSPLALLSLVTFLVTYFATGSNTFRDREFLLLFNAILIAVLALIFFSVANQQLKAQSFQVITLFLLALVAISVNLVALAAIIERISMYGMSPNKLAVLGSNVFILIHLVLVALPLGKAAFSSDSLEHVEKRMVQYLPVYGIWLLFVCVAFPLIF